MKKFLTQLLTSTLAYILGSVIVLLFVFIIVANSVRNATQTPEVEVKEGTVLHLKLNGLLEDRVPADAPFQKFTNQGFGPIGLWEITRALNAARDDDRIVGVHLDVEIMGSGLANLRTLRAALDSFKLSGKFIHAYGEVYTEGTLYLASAADTVWLYPEGAIAWDGMATVLSYFRGFLDKWGIEPQVIRVGKYKSAVEPFLQKSISPENREQLERLLNVAWNDMTTTIGAARGISPAELKRMAYDLSLRTAEDAVEAGMIDGLKYPDEVEAFYRETLELEEDDDLPMLSVSKYVKAISGNTMSEKVAVVFANGGIQMGKGDQETIGAETMKRTLRKLRRDENVKAVVLRINSPGGSALASDIIARELELLKAEKPVIASMGNLAASGGYYIAAPCDYIFAEPTTVTGSIGVFGVLFNAEPFFRRELAVNIEEVYADSTPHADMGMGNRPMTALELAAIQEAVDDIYEDFLEVVKKGRGFASTEAVHELAQGRVWMGLDALDHKLVDELGTLDHAIARAATDAGLSSYRTVLFPKVQSPIEALLEDLKNSASVEQAFLQERHLPPGTRQAVKTAQAMMRHPNHVWALPSFFSLNIR